MSVPKKGMHPKGDTIAAHERGLKEPERVHRKLVSLSEVWGRTWDDGTVGLSMKLLTDPTKRSDVLVVLSVQHEDVRFVGFVSGRDLLDALERVYDGMKTDSIKWREDRPFEG